MNFTQIRYVLEIARQKNFSKAAKALFVSQPALSHQIKNLENELQVKLFWRSTREVFLTKAGEEFYHYGSKIIDDLTTLTGAMEKYRKNANTQLSIGYVPSFPCCERFQQVLSFFRENPNINVNFIVDLPEVLFDGLDSGSLDIVFADFPEGMDLQRTPAHESHLMVRERCYLIVSKAHPLSRKEYISQEDVDQLEIIGIPKNSLKNRQTQESFKYNSSFMQGKVQTVDMNTRITLVRNNMGMILGPRYLADYFDLAAVPIEPPKMGSGIYMVYVQYTNGDPVILKFRDYMLAGQSGGLELAGELGLSGEPDLSGELKESGDPELSGRPGLSDEPEKSDEPEASFGRG